MADRNISYNSKPNVAWCESVTTGGAGVNKSDKHSFDLHNRMCVTDESF